MDILGISEDAENQELKQPKAVIQTIRNRVDLPGQVSNPRIVSVDLLALLQDVLDHARRLNEAHYGVLSVFNASGEVDHLVTSGITAHDGQHNGPILESLGVLGLLEGIKGPFDLADLQAHPNFDQWPLRNPQMTAFLGFPISIDGHPTGNIYLAEKASGEPFTPDDQHLLEVFSAQAAMAIQNSWLAQRLRTEQGHLEAILNNSTDGLIFVDPASGLMRANRRAEEILGSSFQQGDRLDSLAGRCTDAAGTPVTVERYPASRALEGESVPADEFLVLLPDGTTRPVICSAEPIHDEDGELLGALVQFQCVNRARDAQTPRSEAEGQYQSIVENAGDGIFQTTPEGRYLSANPALARMYGYDSPDELLEAVSDLEQQHYVDPARRAELARVLREQATVIGFESEVYRKDGTTIWVSVSARAVLDGSGNISCFEGIAKDVTDRKLAEDLASAERRRLQTLIDTSPVGIIVVEGKDRNTVLVNREMERISSGYPISLADQPDADGQSVVFRRPDGVEYLRKDRPLQRALINGETTRAEEVLFELPDGRKIPTLVNATPVYSQDQQITGAIAVVQDMTPLEEVEKLRSEFLGIVSHELRTPLTAIKGSAATVLGTQRPISTDEYTEFFSIIDEQADRLRDLVDNLLDMTRIEAGSLTVAPEPIELGEVLEEARTNFIRSGGIQELVVHLPEGLPAIEGDRRRISQVMANLIGNAAKFSPATKPITVSVEFDDVHATVRVQDQGHGIPRDKIHQLFRKFSRVHDEKVRNLSGSGLGLAICKGIVEAHGGRIWAESPGEGKGATFSFTLPVAVAREEPVQIDTTKRADHLGKVRRPGERSRVLIVDDEVQVLRYLERTLQDAGYQPVMTQEPERVAALIEQEEPDLVLLDVMLPGMDGFQLLQHIREFSGVPVVFLTARDNDEDRVRALKNGADDYITKPFSPSELLARIEVALRRRMMPDQIEVRAPFLLGDLQLDFTRRRVTVGGELISLTATEYKVLYELANHAGLVMTHGQLLQRVWGPEYGGETELVRSFIRNLRRKLGDDARNPRYIFTEPQVGYRMPNP